MDEELDGQIWPAKEYFVRYEYKKPDNTAMSGWGIHERKSAAQVILDLQEMLEKSEPGYKYLKVVEIKRV